MVTRVNKAIYFKKRFPVINKTYFLTRYYPPASSIRGKLHNNDVDCWNYTFFQWTAMD